MLRLSYDPHVRIRTMNTVSVVAKKLTWNDIKDFPESHDRTEIVDGELVMSPTPGLSHQRICTLLGANISPFVAEHNLGAFFDNPIHVILAEHVHYEPDLCFIRRERSHILREVFIEGPPDLIIEVISESNRTHDTVVKFSHYAQYGVEEYWLADPREKVITTWSLEQGEYALLGRFGRGQEVETRVLAGLRLDAEDILGPSEQ